jgi:hypothetical protein
MPRRAATIPVALPSPNTLVLVLAFAIAGFAEINVILQYAVGHLGHSSLAPIARLFALHGEGNVPTWYSSLLFFVAALLLELIARATSPDRRQARRWTCLALVFVLLSLDEAASVHEQLRLPFPTLLGGTVGAWSFLWVIPAVGLAAVVGFAVVSLLANLPPGTRWLFLTSAAIFLSGELGVERLGAYHLDLHGDRTMTYLLVTTMEESLEMAGVSLFILALLGYIRAHLASRPGIEPANPALDGP